MPFVRRSGFVPGRVESPGALARAARSRHLFLTGPTLLVRLAVLLVLTTIVLLPGTGWSSGLATTGWSSGPADAGPGSLPSGDEPLSAMGDVLSPLGELEFPGERPESPSPNDSPAPSDQLEEEERPDEEGGLPSLHALIAAEAERARVFWASTHVTWRLSYPHSPKPPPV